MKKAKKSPREVIDEWLELDLSEAASSGRLPQAFAVEQICEQIGDILSSGRNPVITGESGIGKTAAIYELVRQVAAGQGPRVLEGARIIQLSIRRRASALNSPRSQMRPEMQNLVDALIALQGQVVPFIRDIHLAYKKKEDFNFDKSIYIVGDPQIQHFKWLFAILDMLGFKEENYHLSYGMISLPSGRMKSREGTVVDADEIIEEVEGLAFIEVNNRYPDLTDDEKKKRANIIALSAVIFYILKYNHLKGFVFKPDESISFEGETGPYIQYCYARIASIISKSEEEIEPNINWELLSHEKETLLIKQLVYFPEIIDTIEKTYNINLIPQYLLSLCQAFNSFYTSCKVISNDKELEKARLLLIRCVQIVIKIGLNILGIDTLEQM